MYDDSNLFKFMYKLSSLFQTERLEMSNVDMETLSEYPYSYMLEHICKISTNDLRSSRGGLHMFPRSCGIKDTTADFVCCNSVQRATVIMVIGPI